MNRHVIGIILSFACAFSARTILAINIPTVPVGYVGNPNDTIDFDPSAPGVQSFGRVDYAYNIGKYEVTVGQYTAFLNAVAATDTYSLYDPDMADTTYGAGISRSGSSGSYSYSVTGSPNNPVTFVNWGDAARFANWLHNGQLTGSQNASTTEDGAYFLNGAISDEALNAVTRKSGARWFIPTESEWYKAAYYQPAAQGGDSDSYWLYPTKSNSAPYSDQPPGSTPDNTRVANYYRDDQVANGYDDGYAATGSPACCLDGNYLTDVGAYISSPSFFGTFDQGGNLAEWNEALINGEFRELRGGAWLFLDRLQASARDLTDPNTQYVGLTGFRVASIPGAVGDFDGNGRVDTADYVTWRKNSGTLQDYSQWRANFGTGIGAGSGNLFAAVPEPFGLPVLSVCAWLACLSFGCRRLGVSRLLTTM